MGVEILVRDIYVRDIHDIIMTLEDENKDEQHAIQPRLIILHCFTKHWSTKCQNINYGYSSWVGLMRIYVEMYEHSTMMATAFYLYANLFDNS